MAALAAGLLVCGDRLATAGESPDFVAAWGLRQQIPIEYAGLPRLYLEAGYINGNGADYVSNRLRFISLGWNGLHGNSRPITGYRPDRWERLGIEPREWRQPGPRVLLLKQHPGDAVLVGADYDALRNELHLAGFEVIEREHPLVNGNGVPLYMHLARCDCAVTYCSTSAVEALVAGVPTVTLDPSSIAWRVTSHTLGVWSMPDLTDWLYELAYRQWTLDELANGSAWAYYREQLWNG